MGLQEPETERRASRQLEGSLLHREELERQQISHSNALPPTRPHLLIGEPHACHSAYIEVREPHCGVAVIFPLLYEFWDQVSRPPGKHLYSLSHLIGSRKHSSKAEEVGGPGEVFAWDSV